MEEQINIEKRTGFVSQNGVKAADVFLKDSIITMDVSNINQEKYLDFYIRSN